jgi:hypothetical protein
MGQDASLVRVAARRVVAVDEFGIETEARGDDLELLLERFLIVFGVELDFRFRTLIVALDSRYPSEQSAVVSENVG